MKKLVTVILCVFYALTAVGEERDSLLLVFWNLENFFDYKDDGISASEGDFSSSGSRRWTKKRFYTKCNAVAKTLLWLADEHGRLPDAVGVAEVENEFVLRQLIKSTALQKYGYSYVHYDSPDPRGIDVGLLYRKETMRLVSSSPHRVDGLATRDILEADFETVEKGHSVHVLVNHHPSKLGGGQGRRESAMRALKALADSLRQAARPPAAAASQAADSPARQGQAVGEPLGERPQSEAQAPGVTVAMGDFNDTPAAEAFGILDGCLVNMATAMHEKGRGTIRYEGKWELIDMFLVSDYLQDKSVMNIEYVPFLLVKDSAHSGQKPFRTYSGPRYIGGVSDHLPITLQFVIGEK